MTYSVEPQIVKKYWFGDVTAKELLNSIGITETDKPVAYRMAERILRKSRIDFFNGSKKAMTDVIYKELKLYSCMKH